MRKYHAPFGGGQKEKQVMLLAGCLPYVVHHALCNVIEPIFEVRFHPHSYANRVGKGTHRAVDQLQAYARRYRYVLRLDIVKHFPSLDHAVLKEELFHVIDDDEIRWLIDVILRSGEGVLADEYEPVTFPGDTPQDASRRRGLPIGNLTSQFWSNCYLNPLDLHQIPDNQRLLPLTFFPFLIVRLPLQLDVV